MTYEDRLDGLVKTVNPENRASIFPLLVDLALPALAIEHRLL